MKRFLIGSLAVNVILCLAIIWSRARYQPGAVRFPQVSAGESHGSALVVSRSNSFHGTVQSDGHDPAFLWSDLESSDYRKYVANLRSIGCPEQTLRDIIVADVHGLFAKQRGKSDALFWQQLSGEEQAVVTALLGPVRNETQTLPNAVLSRANRSSLHETNAVMPLAFQELRAPLDLTEHQAQAIQWLRKEFTTALGSERDPNDPAYLSRWQQAQKASDAMLGGLLGPEFSVRYKLKLMEEGQN